MWGYYGPDYDLDDSVYLTEISKRSREHAHALAESTIQKLNDSRLLVFDVLLLAAWQEHIECECVLENQDPTVRVEAAAEMLDIILAEDSDETGEGLPEMLERWHQQDLTYTDISTMLAHRIINDPRLGEQVMLAQQRLEH